MEIRKGAITGRSPLLVGCDILQGQYEDCPIEAIANLRNVVNFIDFRSIGDYIVGTRIGNWIERDVGTPAGELEAGTGLRIIANDVNFGLGSVPARYCGTLSMLNSTGAIGAGSYTERVGLMVPSPSNRFSYMNPCFFGARVLVRNLLGGSPLRGYSALGFVNQGTTDFWDVSGTPTRLASGSGGPLHGVWLYHNDGLVADDTAAGWNLEVRGDFDDSDGVVTIPNASPWRNEAGLETDEYRYEWLDFVCRLDRTAPRWRVSQGGGDYRLRIWVNGVKCYDLPNGHGPTFGLKFFMSNVSADALGSIMLLDYVWSAFSRADFADLYI